MLFNGFLRSTIYGSKLMLSDEIKYELTFTSMYIGMYDYKKY